jgi:hypothetical protein
MINFISLALKHSCWWLLTSSAKFQTHASWVARCDEGAVFVPLLQYFSHCPIASLALGRSYCGIVDLTAKRHHLVQRHIYMASYIYIYIYIYIYLHLTHSETCLISLSLSYTENTGFDLFGNITLYMAPNNVWCIMVRGKVWELSGFILKSQFLRLSAS